MAKNSTDAYGALGKTNLLMFNPDALTLVTDPAHALFDSRVHLPVSEALVLNIMHQGVLQPIVINKNTETGAVEVVAGRQRVKAAREANKRLRAQGCEPVQVPGVIRRAGGADLAGVMVSENELRDADTPIGRAEKMRALMNRGKTEAELAIYFGCAAATIKSTLALLDCTAAVRDAVQAGQIGVTHAKALAKLDPEAQRTKVAELVAAGQGATGQEKARKQRAVVAPKEGPQMRSKREIVAQRDASPEGSDRRRTLDWVLGTVA